MPKNMGSWPDTKLTPRSTSYILNEFRLLAVAFVLVRYRFFAEI